MLRFLILVALTGAVSPAGPPVIPPASNKWTVDFADDHCLAFRSFAIDGSAVQLSIRPPLDGGTTRLLVHKTFREMRVVAEPPVALDFGDARPTFRTTMHPALSSQGIAMIIDLPPAEAERLRAAKMVTLKSSSKVRGQFDLGPTKALYEALDRCVADLRGRIGLGQGAPPWVENATPATDLGSLFTSAKFWTVEDRMPKTNKVTVRLLIDKSGAVRDCSVTAGSGSTGLDIETCQVFQLRVKYKPARTANGQPVASIVTQTIQWRS